MSLNSVSSFIQNSIVGDEFISYRDDSSLERRTNFVRAQTLATLPSQSKGVIVQFLYTKKICVGRMYVDIETIIALRQVCRTWNEALKGLSHDLPDLLETRELEKGYSQKLIAACLEGGVVIGKLPVLEAFNRVDLGFRPGHPDWYDSLPGVNLLRLGLNRGEVMGIVVRFISKTNRRYAVIFYDLSASDPLKFEITYGKCDAALKNKHNDPSAFLTALLKGEDPDYQLPKYQLTEEKKE